MVSLSVVSLKRSTAGGNPKVGRSRLVHIKCGNVFFWESKNLRVPKWVALPAREEGGDGCWLGKILKSECLI